MRPYDYVLLPLNEIFSHLGYYTKPEKCSKHHITMSNESGEVLIITRKPNGHYLYFNPFRESDKGNVHQFCKKRGIKAGDLIEGKITTLPSTHKVLPTELNNQEIKAVAHFKTFKSINLKSQNIILRGGYLKKRGIKEEIFAKLNIKIDPRNNTCFPLYCYEQQNYSNDLTLCGYTAKLNQEITTDKQGKPYAKPIKSLSFGKKGLEILKHLRIRSLGEVKTIIITESILDSLSLLQLQNLDPQTSLLCATGGTITQTTQNTLSFLFQNCHQETTILLGFDNDKQGKTFNQNIQKLTQTYNLTTQIQIPTFKDFNEDLTNKN